MQTNDRGIYFYDDFLGVVKVAREGDSLLGSVITNVLFADSSEEKGAERSGLNNRGQVAFHFTLADAREGIAVWKIPEPATDALLGACGVALLAVGRGSRRRRTIA